MKLGPRCFFAGQGPCDGRLVRAHLIPKQLIRRELGPEWMWDERVWVPCCGGPTGIGGHHGRLDSARTLRVTRSNLPEGLEQFAHEHGLEWFLARAYGERDS